MHDSPVWSLFHRTGQGEKAPEAAPTRTAEEEPAPEPPSKPDAPSNRRLMELARAVELAGAPPPEDDDEDEGEPA
jgi:hypothetical protein